MAFSFFQNSRKWLVERCLECLWKLSMMRYFLGLQRQGLSSLSFGMLWGTKGAQQVVLESEKEKLEGKVAEIALEGEKEKLEAEIEWDRDGGAVCVTYSDLIHQFKLEYGHITYMKVTTSADGDEKDSFDTKLLEEELSILWDLKEKKEEKEQKAKEEKDKAEELVKELDKVENEIKGLVTMFITLGLKKSCEDLRNLANKEQKRKKLMKEMSQMKDEPVEKVMRDRKLEENQRKREEKKKRKEQRERKKGKKVPTAPDATATEATASASTVPEATVPEAKILDRERPSKFH